MSALRVRIRTRRSALGLLLGAVSLAACGKVGAPKPPEGRDLKAPRFYPAQQVQPQGGEEQPPAPGAPQTEPPPEQLTPERVPGAPPSSLGYPPQISPRDLYYPR